MDYTGYNEGLINPGFLDGANCWADIRSIGGLRPVHGGDMGNAQIHSVIQENYNRDLQLKVLKS